MNGCEIIRMVLCLCGYDREVKVSSYKGDCGAQGYEYYAENNNGNDISDINCEGLVYNVWNIINLSKENVNPAPMVDLSWLDVPQYVFKSDKSVNELKAAWDEHEMKVCRNNERTRPISEWLQKNNPYSEECIKNDHSYPYAGNYGCDKQYRHNCPRLREFDVKFKEFKDNFWKTIEEKTEKNEDNSNK